MSRVRGNIIDFLRIAGAFMWGLLFGAKNLASWLGHSEQLWVWFSGVAVLLTLLFVVLAGLWARVDENQAA
jgi:hypothetical protein